ncbi:hypothetical protein C1645_795515 [Glomus cerebriforme]|uniref:TLC domain-containing protein n=1 Tax=Glomus cerebriforme TaxID=658196 RepID=A0A397RWX6_9GLOM|nr:hypothetical protein C1645_795515 [Glomus cerebriforme]
MIFQLLLLFYSFLFSINFHFFIHFFLILSKVFSYFTISSSVDLSKSVTILAMLFFIFLKKLIILFYKFL